MTLGHLLYISDAVKPMTTIELGNIQFVSARYNAGKDITGVLFYSAGHFVQLLEGDMTDIHSLFEKIAVDPRHRRVRLLLLRPAQRRIFKDWSMGVLDLDQYTSAERSDLNELVRLAEQGDAQTPGTPVELEILSRFCMLLPSG